MTPSLIANPDVWMEGGALEQLDRAAALAGCVRAVGLPDLHPGPGGMPIGVALAFEDAILPSLLGSDVGCGVRVVLTRLRRPSLDRLERRLRSVLESPISLGEIPGVTEALLAQGVHGLAGLESLPASLRQLAAAEPPEDALDPTLLAPDLLAPLHADALGTVGGGNHFAELAFVSDVNRSDDAGAGLGDRLAVIVHSGSRGLGHQVGERFGGQRLASADAGAFLAAQRWACRFAHANRFLLAWQLLSAAEAARPDKQALAVDCVHNQVVRRPLDGREVWLHRKGAAPAEGGQLTVVLGSRGAPTHLMRGTGQTSALESVAHGAGRRMTRSEALSKMRAKHPRDTLRRTRLGSRVLCDRTETLYEEHPDVYKAIEPIIESITTAGLATPVATLTPLLTVKQ
ncbi:MAG: RtcB family protein [Myxococcales bacterium]